MSPPESASALLRGNYASVAKELVAPLLDLLAISRPVFGGDLDKLLIILVVALRTAEDPKLSEALVADALSGRIQAFPSLLTNVRSIAESTGVPRETVRRKVVQLVEEGWIKREGDYLSYTPAAHRDLAPVRDAMIDAAVRFHALVQRLTAPER